MTLLSPSTQSLLPQGQLQMDLDNVTQRHRNEQENE